MTEDVKVEFDIASFEIEVFEICSRDICLTEAIVIWAEENNVELDLLSSIIKKNSILKSAVEEDARKRNLLKR